MPVDGLPTRRVHARLAGRRLGALPSLEVCVDSRDEWQDVSISPGCGARSASLLSWVEHGGSMQQGLGGAHGGQEWQGPHQRRHLGGLGHGRQGGACRAGGA